MAAARVASTPASSLSASAAACRSRPIMPPSMRIMRRIPSMLR
jgi:hypothetical protein